MQLYMKIAKELALEAGERILKHYGDTSYKEQNDKTPLTQADKEANEIIIEGLKNRFPHKSGAPLHVILSEESADDKRRFTAEYTWIVDPLDGTDDFLKQTGQFATMIALVHQKQPMIGVVYAPAIKKMYSASLFDGAHLEYEGNVRKLAVSQRPLAEAVMMLSRKDFTPEDIATVKTQFGVKEVMQSGSFGVKVGAIAEGSADVYVNSSLRAGEWDACAPGVIIREAGGKMTDFLGKEIMFNTHDKPYLPNGAVCTNGVVHEEILSRVQQHITLK